MMTSKLKIIFLTNVPSPYRIQFFNELALMCDLTVLYQKASSSERNPNWIADKNNTYISIFLKGKSVGTDKAFCPEVVKYINKSFDFVIICGNASPTEILAIEWCKVMHIPYCLEGDGAFAKTGNSIKEKLKKRLISGGMLFFSTCYEHDKYYMHYGADIKNIVRYRFSSLLKSDILECQLSKEQKNIYRNELGIQEKKIVLAVGQFISRKGFDVLLKAAVNLDDDIGIYIVGDVATREYLDLVENLKLTRVHFEGFKTKNELKKYYKAADVFVLPTREDIWGLVINEAMANGLPVITTNKCNAGLELIKDGKNGFIVNVDDVEELSDRIKDSLNESVALGEKALETIKDYTIENMALDHVNILNEIHSIGRAI